MSRPDVVAYAVDAALAFIVIEAIALLVLRPARWTAWLANLGAGLALMLALRAALAGAAWPLILAALTAAGAAHALELVLRRRSVSAGSP